MSNAADHKTTAYAAVSLRHALASIGIVAQVGEIGDCDHGVVDAIPHDDGPAWKVYVAAESPQFTLVESSEECATDSLRAIVSAIRRCKR